MNPLFVPNDEEERLILKIQRYYRGDFALIRMTETMLKKGIVDASDGLRRILKEAELINYGDIQQGEKILKKALVVTENEILERKTSFYRPKTKQGDPRFWIYGFTKIVKHDELIYFTIHDQRLIAIPLIDSIQFESNLVALFGTNAKEDTVLVDLTQKLTDIKRKGWILSVSPYKKAPKDAGDTLERELGLKPNNLISADYMGQIELKTKRIRSGTKDTLFSKVPNWEISEIKSSTDMILEFGYESHNQKKYPGFKDLYITVSNKPNNQGLFIGTDEEQEYVFQRYVNNFIEKDTCYWEYKSLKHSLLLKHPKTAWIVADESIIDGKIHYKYDKVQLTQKPIFTQFLSLIDQGIITFDWRGRVKLDRTGYKDKGHCFRIKPRLRHLLFGETKELEI